MKGYTKVSSRFIDDIQSNVTIYRHDKSGARVCTFENDDNNKVFSIAFRTPAINNGGLTHILEHSVLCGSKKYPVKDPFVELLKSSLNTFLNAFTFPDKTMYPCASQNDKDFKNLMSVYMDSVFYPQIYNHEEIFMQEGWHYHILDEKDPITYNGVVYNEMKGAFSDPQQILFRELMHSIFPDTTYGFESGGNPKYIPDLSYEEFKDFHSKFYHPANSYIFIYGNCDMEERMAWLDEEYLKDFDCIDFDTTIKYQKPFTAPVSQTSYYPVAENQSLDNKTFLSYNVAFPSTLDTKLVLASSILVDVLLNNPGAPLKQAIVDAKLGEDCMAFMDDGLLQPLLCIAVVNSNPDKEQDFIELINNSLKDILEKGLDHDALRSLINFQEFKLREAKFGHMPKGLEIQINVLSSWLYDENNPYDKIEILKYFDDLRAGLDNGYFESIIKDYILNNSHKTYVKLVPSYTCAKEEEKKLADKLQAYKDSLSKEELAKLIQKNQDLVAYQSAPSTEEEKATLPKLTIEDLSLEPEKLNCQEIKGKYPTLFADYFTNGIHYMGYLFDITGISKDDIQYVKLLVDLYKNISTNENNYGLINNEIQNLTGGLSFDVTSFKTVDKLCKSFVNVKYSALDSNLDKANSLVLDIIYNSNLKDTKRLYERISELNVGLEMSVAQRGHVVSMVRASSYCDFNSLLVDATTGIGYLDFIHNLYVNFESVKEDLVAKLSDIVGKVFNKNNFLFKFTGNEECLSNAIKVVDSFYDKLANVDYKFVNNDKPVQLNEAFKTQYDVNFVARAGLYNGEFNGAMYVLSNALSMDYLWMQVRVHGGAYGCMMNAPYTGGIAFMSYRDPEIARTNNVYDNVVDYINGLELNGLDDLLKFKIGAIGSLDQVMHVSDKGDMACMQVLSGNSYELKAKYRKQAIEATRDDLISLAKNFEEALACGNLCVIGNANKIEENKDLFKNVRSLVE